MFASIMGGRNVIGSGDAFGGALIPGVGETSDGGGAVSFVVSCGCLPCGVTSIHGEGALGVVVCDVLGTGVFDVEKGVGNVVCWVVRCGDAGVGSSLVGVFVVMCWVRSGGGGVCVMG